MIVSSIIASVEGSSEALRKDWEDEESRELSLGASLSLEDVSEEVIYKRGKVVSYPPRKFLPTACFNS
jgi:hypothetical protein